MRTDVKIGITTGLVVCVGILLYFVFMNKEAKPHRDREPDFGLRTDGAPLSTPRAEATARPSAAPSLRPTPAPSPAITLADPNSTVISEVRPQRPSDGHVEIAVRDSNKPSEIVIDTPRETARPEPGHTGSDAVLLPVIPGKPEGLRSPEPNAARPDLAKTSVNEEPGVIITGPGGEKYYIVKKGDNGLWDVAKKVYGEGRKWEVVAAANPPDVSRNPLRPGQKILLPAGVAATEAPAVPPLTLNPTSKPAVEGDKYVVKSGDGLEVIARKFYNDGSLWPAIAKANPSVDATRLRVGQELIIPSLNDAKRMLGVAPTTSTSRPTTERVRPSATPKPTDKPKSTDKGVPFD